MKLKYIFASIVATLALVGCQKEADHYLDAIKVSSSYVALSTGVGANTSITVSATDSWYVAIDEATAKWLTVSPTMGGAGEAPLLSLPPQAKAVPPRYLSSAVNRPSTSM